MKEERTYIDIAFYYEKILYVERIYTDQIDKDHYENMWDWWFGCKKNDDNPNLVFELTGNKNEEGQFITEDMYINVYAKEYDDTPIDVIENISYRKSWIDMIGFN